MPQKVQPMSRGAEREELRFAQSRPAQHAENQYEGFFKGMGSTSKEVICSKKASQLKRLHEATHFAIGCQKWDEEMSHRGEPRWRRFCSFYRILCDRHGDTRGASVSHSTFVDPEVVYATCDAPDKNMSVVELRQQVFKPVTHYRTEQRDRFEDPGPQPKNDPLIPPVTVHLGDDQPGYALQSHAVHRKIPETWSGVPTDVDHQRYQWGLSEAEEHHGARALRAAGSGVLIPTAVFPKPVRCNPLQLAAMGFGKPEEACQRSPEIVKTRL
eukprot:g6369.t1